MAAHAIAPARAPHVVVVGLDASDNLDAIEWALQRAHDEAHWVLHFVVVTTLAWGQAHPSTPRGRALVAQIMRRTVHDPALGFRVFVHQIWGEDGVAPLCRFAARSDADLLVVSESADARLARDAGCPVVVARKKRHPRPATH